MEFTPIAFVENLKYMGFGLLGTFLIIGIIVGVTMLFNTAANRLAERRREQNTEE